MKHINILLRSATMAQLNYRAAVKHIDASTKPTKIMVLQDPQQILLSTEHKSWYDYNPCENWRQCGPIIERVLQTGVSMVRYKRSGFYEVEFGPYITWLTDNILEAFVMRDLLLATWPSIKIEKYEVSIPENLL